MSKLPATGRPSKMHRMLCSGRTHWKAEPPQRMLLGQPIARIAPVTMPPSASAVAAPLRSITANQNSASLTSRLSHCSRLSKPTERRKPSIALSGEPTRGPFPFLADIGLPPGQTRDAQADAARRRESPDVAMFEAGLLQPIGDEPLKVGARPVLHPGRDFLGQQLQQQVRHRRRPLRRCPVRPGCRATPGSRRAPASAPAGCRTAARSR